MVQEAETTVLNSMTLWHSGVEDTSDPSSLRKELLNRLDFDVHERLLDLDISAGAIYAVDLVKSTEGFGFNIVGGIDSQHLPDHDGIFVSMIKKNGPAKKDGRIKEGDRIISLNGRELSGLTHDEAVNVFRSVGIGQSASLIIEAKGDSIIVKEPHVYPVLPKIFYNEFDGSVDLAQPTKHASDEVENDDTEDLSDAESVVSYVPSQHSIIDDVPRTPKKPLSILDPRNNSVFTEVLYVSIGLAVISGACIIGYKMHSRGRS